ncbi:MAG: pilin [Candidatus Paceibacterota bacterium]|jgi:hypothetical protein
MDFKNIKINTRTLTSFVFVIFSVLGTILFLPTVFAQTTQLPTSDISDPGFRLLICDGPDIPPQVLSAQPNLIPKDNAAFKAKFGHDLPYIPCNFVGAMMQIQHFINIAIVLGVVAAVLSFSWAGFLFMKGDQASRGKAKKIFPRVVVGFIIMLCAWFVVYQLVAWLTGSTNSNVLLGNTNSTATQ